MKISKQGERIINAFKENPINKELLRKILSFECLDTGGAYCLDEEGTYYLLRKLGLIYDIEEYIKELQKYSSRFLVCGSIRREKINPRDVDIVLIPKDKKGLLSFIHESNAEIVQQGEKQIYLTIPCLYKTIPLQIWFATTENWGAQILTRTGGKFYNIALRTIAKKKGWLLNQYGLFDEKNILLASKTEEDIAKALGKTLREPKDRF